LPPAAELDRLCVVLVSTRNPLNMGAAARAMGNFGFSCLRVVNPYAPSFREARSAVGAAKLLASAEEYKSVAEAVAECTLVVGTTAARNRELQQPLKPLAEGARMIRKQLASRRVALLFGSEKRGLSNQDLSHCHWLMRIPTLEDLPSMNLGQAVAICLYEMARSTVKAKAALKDRSARAAELERLTVLLMELLLTSGYADAGSGYKAEQKVRRLVRRLALSSVDAETWLGMLRQILWKLRSSESR
jgi:TrmH family RNA methyltransferase